MFERLEQTEARYEELGQQVADPGLIADQSKYQKIAKQNRDVENVVEKFREYRQVRNGIADAKALLNETDDIRAMAAEELAELEAREPKLEEDLKLLLLPKDPNDEKNVIVEIRAGTDAPCSSLRRALCRAS